MKAEKFQQKILGTAVCTKRLMMATKGCGQLTSNGTYFFGSQFIGLEAAEEAISEVVEYFEPVNTSPKVFFLAGLKN